QAESSRCELLDEKAAPALVGRECEAKAVFLEQTEVLRHRDEVVPMSEQQPRTIRREGRRLAHRSVRIVPVLFSKLQHFDTSVSEDPAGLLDELGLPLEEANRHGRIDQVETLVVEMQTAGVVKMQLRYPEARQRRFRHRAEPPGDLAEVLTALDRGAAIDVDAVKVDGLIPKHPRELGERAPPAEADLEHGKGSAVRRESGQRLFDDAGALDDLAADLREAAASRRDRHNAIPHIQNR